VRDQLEAYAWPGNVRELHNVLERAAILSTGRELKLPPGALPARGERTGRPATWEAQERTYLERLLQHTRGKIAGPDGAAALADLAPSTLLSRLEKLGLRPRDFREA
jgi:DNA-binding NtrC family response regulator